MPDPRPDLAVLEAAGLVRQVVAPPDLAYLFRHVLIQDAVYSSLLRADRRRLHHEVAEILAALYPSDQDALAPVLARHFALAGDTGQARTCYERAGARALARYSNHEAEAHYRAALALAAADGDRARLLAGLGAALDRQSRYAETIASWDAARTCYAALGDRDGLARATAEIAGTTFNAGDVRGGLRICLAGLEATAGDPASRGLIALLNMTAQLFYFNGHNAEARRYAHQARDLAVRTGTQYAQILALLTLGTAESENRLASRDTLEQAAVLAEATENLALAQHAHQNLGAPLLELGDLRAARQHYARAAEFARQMHDPTSELLAGAAEACCMTWLGEHRAVAAALPALHTLAGQVPVAGLGQALLQIAAALLLRCQGACAAALAGFEAVVAETRQRGDLQFLIVGARELSGLLLDQGLWERAGAVLEMILPVSDQGILFGRAWPRCRLSEVAAATGERAAAHRRLAEARAIAGPAPLLPDAEGLALATGRLAAAEGRWPDAHAAYAAAVAAQAQQGRAWERARTLQTWAAVYQAEGPPAARAAARALLTAAETTFTALDMVLYAERAAAQRAALGT